MEMAQVLLHTTLTALSFVIRETAMMVPRSDACLVTSQPHESRFKTSFTETRS